MHRSSPNSPNRACTTSRTDCVVQRLSKMAKPDSFTCTFGQAAMSCMPRLHSNLSPAKGIPQWLITICRSPCLSASALAKAQSQFLACNSKTPHSATRPTFRRNFSSWKSLGPVCSDGSSGCGPRSDCRTPRNRPPAASACCRSRSPASGRERSTYATMAVGWPVASASPRSQRVSCRSSPRSNSPCTCTVSSCAGAAARASER
mmetsp:Transcript_96928/g.289555  ORF Transcript_96928/g.289555 Transcript_96928/m.289555 type:complete len:204 (-) Transcript_96928:162-773(-)